MKYLYIVATLFTLLFFCFSISCAEIDPVKSFDAGIELIESGKYLKASRMLSQSLEAGLKGERLNKAYEILYCLSFILDDHNKIQQLETKCKSLIKDFVPLLNKPFTLEFYISDKLDDDINFKTSGRNLPDGTKILYHMETNEYSVRKTPYIVKKDGYDFTKLITKVRMLFDNRYNEFYLSLNFDKEGSQLFEKITKNNIQRKCVIVFNGEILTAPVIQESISSGKIRIHSQKPYRLLALIEKNLAN